MRALDTLDGASDLTNGVKPGQSGIFSSAQHSAQIRMFQRLAFGGSQDYSSDFYNQSQTSWRSREYEDRSSNMPWVCLWYAELETNFWNMIGNQKQLEALIWDPETRSCCLILVQIQLRLCIFFLIFVHSAKKNDYFCRNCWFFILCYTYRLTQLPFVSLSVKVI